MSPWILKRATGDGPRYEVRYRLGGRGPQLYGGRFRRQADAQARARFIEGEIAALRVPDLRAPAALPPSRTPGPVGRRLGRGPHRRLAGHARRTTSSTWPAGGRWAR